MQGRHRNDCPSRVRLLSALVASCFAGAALANPTGMQVANGAVSASTVGSTLSITNSPGSIINWQSFSIGAREAVRFNQVNAQSAVLNRVVGQDPSAILGSLWSNGKVFLVNPNGVLFGAGARIDVAGLVATTLNITDSDFLAGKLNFAAGQVAGSVVVESDAAIRAANGGFVYLIAPDIQNHGVINAPNGEVLLAAGKSVRMVEADVPNLAVEVEAGGEALNVGQILTEGGKAGIYAGVINQRGIVRADSVSRDATGRIVFRAADKTILEAGSVTSASGARGGTVQLLGDKVGVMDGAQVDASGASGGGTVLVGGDYQGKNPDVPNASRTYVGRDAVIRADATDAGDGGKVIVWSNEATGMYGTVTARGGDHGGNGGFVEVSSKGGLDFRGTVDTSAPKGTAGTLLLDPKNLTIEAANPDINGDSTPGDDLSALAILFTDFDGANSVITAGAVDAQLLLNNVLLQADNDITVNAAIAGLTPAKTLTMEAGRSILINADVSTTDAAITLVANSPAAQSANRDPGLGGITMASATTLGAGTGKVTLQVGPGLAPGTGGSIVVENITAADVELQQNADTPGASILRASGSSLITAQNLLMEVENLGAIGGSIGTSSAPMRLSVTNLEAHTHELGPGIFIDATPGASLSIGNVPFFPGVVKGVQTVAGGEIQIKANDLVVPAGTAVCGSGSSIDTGGVICTATANDNITIRTDTITIGNKIGTLGGGTGVTTIAPLTASRPLAVEADIDKNYCLDDLGSCLSITASELGRITGGGLQLGDSNTGALTVATTLNSGAGGQIQVGTFTLMGDTVVVDAAIDRSISGGGVDGVTTLNSVNGISINAGLNAGSNGIVQFSGSGDVQFGGSPVAVTAKQVNSSGPSVIVGALQDATFFLTDATNASSWAGGLIINDSGALTVNSAAPVAVVANGLNWFGGTYGSSIGGTGVVRAVGPGSILPGGSGVLLAGKLELGDGTTPSAFSLGAGDVTGGGDLKINANASLSVSESAALGTDAARLGTVANFGTIVVNASAGPATLQVHDSAGEFANSSQVVLTSPNGNVATLETGTLHNLPGAQVIALLDGGGPRQINGNVLNDGWITLDRTPLQINGNFTQTSTGTLYATIQSVATAGNLPVFGTATLGGTLTVDGVGGYTPQSGGDDLVILSATGNVTGTFSSVTSANLTVTPTYNPADVTVNAQAITSLVIWDGGAGTLNWLDANNWSTNNVPISTDDVQIPELSGTQTIFIPSGAQSAKSVVITGDDTLLLSGGSLSVANASSAVNGTLSIGGGSLAGSGDWTVANLILSGGSLNTSGAVVVNNSMTWSGGTQSGAGSTTVANTASLAITGSSMVLDGRTFTNSSASGIWSGTGQITLRNGALFQNAGTLTATSDGTVRADAGVAVFVNSGTFSKNGGVGTTTFDQGGGTLAVNNTGIIEVQTGTLALNGLGGGFNNNGQVTLADTTAMTLASGGAGAGTYVLAGTGQVNFTGGTQTFNAGADIAGTGLFKIAGGTMTVASGMNADNLELASGTLNGAGTLLVDGSLKWSGGTMSGAGATDVTAGASLTISGASMVLDGRALYNNSPTALWSGNGQITLRNGALFENSGMILATGDGLMRADAGAGTFTNIGIFSKNGASGTTTFDQAGGTLTLDNSGTFDVQTGTVAINGLGGGFDNDGTVNLGASAQMTLASSGTGVGNYTLGAGSQLTFTTGTQTLTGGSISGAGAFVVNGGTLTVNAPLSADNLQLGSGTINGTGAITANDSFSWTGGTQSGAGSTTVNGTLTMGGSSLVLDARLFTNGGPGGVWFGNGQLTLRNGAEFVNASTLDMQGNGLVRSDAGAGSFTNSGLLGKTVATGTTTFDQAGGTLRFDNTLGGTLDVQTGTVAINGLGGGFNNDGTVNVASGAVLNLASGGAGAGVYTVGGAVNFTNGTLQFNSGAEISGAGTFNVAGGTMTVNASMSADNLTLASGTINGAGDLSVNGSFGWSGGTQSGAGMTTVNGALSISGASMVLDARTFTNNSASGVWSNNGQIALRNGAQFNNFGSLTATGNGLVRADAGAATFFNTGDFVKSAGGGTTTFDQAGGTLRFDNALGGTLDVQTGTVAINGLGGGFNNDGTVNVASGAVLNLASGGAGAGAYTVAGTVNFTSGIQNFNAGADISGPGMFNVSGGTMTVNGPLGADNLALTSGLIEGTGALTVNQGFTWAGGAISGLGGLTTNGTSTLSGASTKTLTGTTWDNFGTVNWTDGAINLSSAATTINNSGTFAATATSFTTDIDGVGTFNNLAGGVFTANAGAFDVSFDGPTATNAGTINVASGRFNYTQSFTNTGTINLGGAGAVFEAFGGTGNLDAGTVFTGTGEVRVLAGATLNVNAPVTLSSTQTLAVQGGLLGGSGDLTVQGGFNWIGGTIGGAGSLDTFGASTLSLGGNTLSGRTWNNFGTANAGVLSLAGGAVIDNESGGVFNFGAGESVGGAGNFNNLAGGIVNVNGAASLAAGTVTNAGTMNLNSGGALSTTGFTTNDGILNFTGGSLSTGAALTNSSTGTIQGAGAITVPTLTNDGTINPGASAGLLTVNGNLVLGSGGTVNIELGGLTRGTQYDAIDVTGNVTLGGTLNVTNISGFTPASGNTFQLINATGTAGGSFATINDPNAMTPVTLAGPPGAFRLLVPGGPFTWDGGAGTFNWTDALNWSTDTVPTAADVVTIPELAGTATITIGSGAQAVKSLVIAGNDTLSILTGGSLDATNASSAANGTLSIAGGSLLGTGAWTVRNLSFNGGTMGAGGTVTLAAGGTSTISGSVTLDRALVSTGTLTLSAPTVGGSGSLTSQGTTNVAAGTATLSIPTVILGSGMLNLFSGATLVHAGGMFSWNGGTVAGPGNLVLSGATLDLGGAGTRTLDGATVDASGVTLGAGLLQVQSGVFNAGTSATVDAGATLKVTGGKFNVGAMGAAMLNVDGGSLTVDGGLNTGTMSLASGSVDGTGNFAVTADFGWTGGSMGSGFNNLNLTSSGNFPLLASLGAVNTLRLAAGGTLAVNQPLGAANVVLEGNVISLDPAGTINAGTLASLTGGTIQARTGVASITSPATQMNAGLLRIEPSGSAPAGISASGDLAVSAGSVLIRGSDTDAGASAKLSAGGGLAMAVGGLTIQGGAADGASASIDPAFINIVSSGNILLAGGAGNDSHALIYSPQGDVSIDAGAASVILQQGTGDRANAAIVADGGFASVNAFTCEGCGVLFTSPVSDGTLTATGVYGSGGALVTVVQGLPEVLVQTINNFFQTVEFVEEVGEQQQEIGEEFVETGGPTGPGGKDEKKKKAPRCS